MMQQGISPPRTPSPLRLPPDVEELREALETGVLPPRPPQTLEEAVGLAEANAEPLSVQLPDRMAPMNRGTISSEVLKEFATRSDMAQRIYDSHIAFLKKLGLLE